LPHGSSKGKPWKSPGTVNGSRDCYAQIANAVERNGKLYLGSIGEDSIGVYALR